MNTNETYNLLDKIKPEDIVPTIQSIVNKFDGCFSGFEFNAVTNSWSASSFINKEITMCGCRRSGKTPIEAILSLHRAFDKRRIRKEK